MGVIQIPGPTLLWDRLHMHHKNILCPLCPLCTIKHFLHGQIFPFYACLFPDVVCAFSLTDVIYRHDFAPQFTLSDPTHTGCFISIFKKMVKWFVSRVRYHLDIIVYDYRFILKTFKISHIHYLPHTVY